MRGRHTSALSREGRDVLWLLAVLSLSIAPHLGRLPLWCALGTGTAIVWRGWLAWRDAALPPRWVLVVAMLAGIGMTAVSHQSVFGREAGVTLVTLLAGLKTLELRARRDAFVITSLGFFLILTQFLFSQSLPVAFLMMLVLLGLLTSLVLAQRPLGRPSIGSAMKTAGQALLMGLPLMLALYLLFPRMGPLWSVPTDAGKRTGLSDHLSLGSVAELAQDDTIAMRLRFAQAVPPASQLYFRGPVLEQFDGKSWRAFARRHEADVPDAPTSATTKGFEYQITVEPSRLNNVPLLDGTVNASAAPPANEPTLRRLGMDWVAARPLLERSQFNATAVERLRHGSHLPPQALQAWTELPTGFNPRTLSWSLRTLQRPGLANADALTLTNVVLQHIRQSGFSYTLAPGEDPVLPNGQPDPHLIDHFWMDSRRGFCEHFATAFVVVMRAMNVPSRVITGYQGAELNPVDGMRVVRNSDAHAWAEVWQSGQGWVRVDPTAAVAPDRIDRTRPALRRPSALPGALSELDPTRWVTLRDYIEAGNHRWNTWVLEYSRKQQANLLRDLGMASPDWPDLLRLCAGALSVFSLGGLVWLWLTRPKRLARPWQRPLMRVHKALVSAGFHPPADCPAPAPALAWATAIERQSRQAENPSLAAAITQSLRDLDAQRYAPRAPSTSSTAALVNALGRLAQQWRQRQPARPRRA